MSTRVKLKPEVAAECGKLIPHVPSPEAATAANAGKRRPGRPEGAIGRLSRAAREHAEATGELPHIFLLRITRGEVISTDVMDPETGQLRKVYEVPDLPMRMDAAKAAAPYFAPKLSAVQVVQDLSDAELDMQLRQVSAQAGFTLAAKQVAAQDEVDDEASADQPWLDEDAEQA